MKVLNLNASVTVVLTAAGMRAVEKQSPLFVEHIKDYTHVYKGKGARNVLTMQLWELFRIFGSELANGAPIVFENNSLFIDESCLHKDVNDLDGIIVESG